MSTNEIRDFTLWRGKNHGSLLVVQFTDDNAVTAKVLYSGNSQLEYDVGDFITVQKEVWHSYMEHIPEAETENSDGFC